MTRRLAALRTPAPPASLALGLSILCSALLVWAPSTEASSAAAVPAQGEATSVAGAGGGEAAQSAAKAEREAKRAARRAQQQAAETSGGAAGGAQAGSSPGATQGATANGREAAHQRAAARHAEKAAERVERKAQKAAEKAAQKSAQTSVGPRALAQPAAGAGQSANQGSGRSKARREREREQRRRQREVRGEKEPRHESRREREANEARLAAGGGEGSSEGIAPATGLGAPAAAVAAAPASTAGTGTAVSASKQPARTQARVAGPRRHVRARSRAGKLLGGPASTPAPVLAPVTSAATRAGGRARGGAPSRPAGHAKTTASPIVTTVTRIIGVVPLSAWIAMAGLAALALLLALSSRLAERRARWLARQRTELLEDVGLLQAALLPELPERLGPVGTTAAYRPASGPGAGGDFYDVFALEDGRLAVIVGDVSGHGRGALPHTTLVRFTLRAYLEAGLSPREALRSAAPVLERQLGGSFATVVLAFFDPRARELTYACAGHPHPLVTGLDEDAAVIACSAPPIGAGRRTGTRQTVVSVPGAARACFYTDGVIEARISGELFGTPRLAQVLRELPAKADAETLLERVSELTEQRPDDMAACLLEVRGGEQAASIEREELELDGRDLEGQRPRRFLAAAGVSDAEAESVLERAQALVAEHGSALLEVRPVAGGASATVFQNNLAPLRARAISRSQEVAL